MKRASLSILLLVAGVAAGLAFWRFAAQRAPEPAPAAAVAARPAPPAATPPPGAAPSGAEAESPPAQEALPREPTLEELGGPWALVDMEEIRQAMPYNLYWEQAAPTDDARLVRQREEDRARWNVEYGKVLSGNATEEEIQAYYAYRHKLFADYVEFVGYVLDHYQDDLPEQDVGLLELARRLHLARLEEIPRRTQEALERKQQQDAAREAWLADEADFESADPEERD
jgi:hypothetical protein